MQRPLRILHTISLNRFAGPAEAVVRLARAQSRCGHEVAIAMDTFKEGDLRKKTEEFGIPIDDRFVLSRKAGSIFHMRDVLTFKKIWMESAVDIIHCHKSHDHTLAAISRPSSTSTRLVRSIFNERAFDTKYAWQLRRTDGLVTMDKSIGKELLNKGLIDSWRVFLLSKAVDPHVYRPGKGAEEVLEALDIAPGSTIAGLVVCDEDLDDLRPVLQSWEKVLEDVPGAVMLLVHVRGDKDKDGFVDGMLSGHESVRCMHVDMCRPEIYRAFTLEIVMPLGERGSTACHRHALEAMASSVPIVVGGENDAAGLLHGGGGVVVDAGQPASLQHALVELLSDTSKAADVGSEARHEATHENAMDLQVEQIAEFYRTLLDGVG